jgi:1-acyl-sn-glycerol-3-phosphate acyltransferase
MSELEQVIDERHSHMLAPSPQFYDFVASQLVKPWLRAWGGVGFEGGELVEDIEGAFIVAPTHRSMNDIPAVTQVFDKITPGTQLHFMAKDSLWKIPLLGTIINAGGGFKANQNANTLPSETWRLIDKLVENDAAITIFAEQHRREGRLVDPGHIAGVPMIAAKYGIPIVPVGIAGTEKGHRRPIRIVVGDPIEVPKSEGKAWVKVARELKLRLPAEMQKLQNRANLLRDLA